MKSGSFDCPTEYVDKLCRELSGAEFKILMVATRKIAGWNKDEDKISYSQFQALTGIKDRSTISGALKKIKALGLLKKSGAPDQEGQAYKLNKPKVQKAKMAEYTPQIDDPKEIIKHLRGLVESQNGMSAAAGISLRVLEQLWNWDRKEEIKKSWQWFLYAAQKWPSAVENALSQVKARKLEKGDVKNPGALITAIIKQESKS